MRHVDTFYRQDARLPVEMGRLCVDLGLPDPLRVPATYRAVRTPIPSRKATSSPEKKRW